MNVTADQVADGFTQLKCLPPFRDEVNQEMLWDGIREGVINQVCLTFKGYLVVPDINVGSMTSILRVFHVPYFILYLGGK